MNRLDRAIQILSEKKYSCVIIDDVGDIRCSREFGIKPLMIELRKDKDAFKGCVIADRIIGKAAALLAVLGKAEAVYGEVMSEVGKEVLDNNQISVQYGQLVSFIYNRTNTGRCPMEETVCDEDSPDKAFELLEQKIQRLMQSK